MSNVKAKNKKGITLIEVLVTVGLTSIITLLIVYSYISGIKSSDFNFKRFSLSSNLDGVVNDIAQNCLLATASPANFNYNGEEYTNDADTLILQLPAINSQGETADGFFDTAVYNFDQASSQLNELIVPNVQSSRVFKDKTIASGVSTVSFTQTPSSKGTMQNINLTINTASMGETTAYSLSRQIRMRNQNY